jgi:hypothetical protein
VRVGVLWVPNIRPGTLICGFGSVLIPPFERAAELASSALVLAREALLSANALVESHGLDDDDDYIAGFA